MIWIKKDRFVLHVSQEARRIQGNFQLKFMI